MMLRFILGLLVVAIGLVSWKLWGPDGVIHRRAEIEKALVHQQEKNKEQRHVNDRLYAEVYSVKFQHEALEERAREQLFMIKPGEVLFELAPPSSLAVNPNQTELPDYSNPDIAPHSKPTFAPKNGDLYKTPTHVSAPKAKIRRE